MSEAVNHPAYYGGDTFHETVKCLAAWGLEQDALLWNVVKYISRAGKKGDLLEDLKKAQWYLDWRIAELEGVPVPIDPCGAHSCDAARDAGLPTCYLPKGHDGPHSAHRPNGGCVWRRRNRSRITH